MSHDPRGPSPPDRPGEPTSAAALAGLRVIDMSTVLAGPNCGRYLADFGADVVKVERPGGDSLRNMAWRDPRDGEGLWWKLVNRNKRTVVLDVKDDTDRSVLLGLVDDAHVLIENSRPGTMERLGLGPDVLLARNPSARDDEGQRVRADRPVRVAARDSPRSPRRCRGSRRSAASPTASRCSRRSPSPTR